MTAMGQQRALGANGSGWLKRADSGRSQRLSMASPTIWPICAILPSVTAHCNKAQMVGACLRCLRVVEVAFDALQSGLVRRLG